jgi:hypothetical protein
LAGILEKEWAFLGKEKTKAIQVYLLFVDFDLGEIRVVCDIKRKARCYRVLDIEADVFFVVGACRLIAAALCLPQNIRRNLQVSLARYL